MTPKSLLRHKLARSQASELTGGGFRPVLAEDVGDEASRSATRLVLCSGKVYYDLLASEERANAKDAVLARVEQLYPFPRREIAELLAGLRPLARSSGHRKSLATWAPARMSHPSCGRSCPKP